MDREKYREVSQEIRRRMKEGEKFEITEDEMIAGFLLVEAIDLEREKEIENAADVFEITDKSHDTEENTVEQCVQLSGNLRELIEDNPEVYEKLSETEQKVINMVGSKPKET